MKAQRERDMTANSTVEKLLCAIARRGNAVPGSSPAVVRVAYQGQGIVWVVPGLAHAID